ncbi:hypothetical protein RJ641_028217 [Dillenia turbinata]|uniref:Uncharacterized protein n=1 Tax=Dillenia turbinata TaxID=194707 RepID=A0AAN8ZR81_9MAGN
MWPILVAAAVAGSGIFATKFFSTKPDSESKYSMINNGESTAKCERERRNEEIEEEKDGVFRFSSKCSGESSRFKSGSKKWKKNVGRFKSRVEVQKLGFVNRKRSGRKSGSSCSSTGEDGSFQHSSCSYSSFFGWGLGVGIMYMMSAGKAEIDKLNTTVDETAKVVHELRTELSKRKASRNPRNSCSMTEANTNSKKIRHKCAHSTLAKELFEIRNPIKMEASSLPVNDGGETPNSVLTEEPAPEYINEMEAELGSELQKLISCAPEASDAAEMYGLCKTEDSQIGYQQEGNCPDSDEFCGVSPSELNQKLCHLLIEQQDSHILELESELHLANSKLHEKDAELKALKDSIRRLTEFSLTAASGKFLFTSINGISFFLYWPCSCFVVKALDYYYLVPYPLPSS